jgi:hypothetical protein
MEYRNLEDIVKELVEQTATKLGISIAFFKGEAVQIANDMQDIVRVKPLDNNKFIFPCIVLLYKDSELKSKEIKILRCNSYEVEIYFAMETNENYSLEQKNTNVFTELFKIKSEFENQIDKFHKDLLPLNISETQRKTKKIINRIDVGANNVDALITEYVFLVSEIN